MSRTLIRTLETVGRIWHVPTTARIRGRTGLFSADIPMAAMISAVNYSKRGSPSDAGSPFKIVTRTRELADDDLNSIESELNWELTASKSNRFYLPNGFGPAWQGYNSTIDLMAPLSEIVNFNKEENKDKSSLEISCCQCPMLIRDTLIELFPVRAVASKDTAITLLTLSYDGDIETGATKFVLAARDISDRLLSMGFWSDFLNPFSGRPYFMPKEDAMLYKQDSRFRGLNMSLTIKNHCMVIAAKEDDNTHFSGTIYCTAPSNYDILVKILSPNDDQLNYNRLF
ncbi:methylmalonic aciduria and homocystinuria type D homolog, mitochondrial [Drosophila pseudoobscura]|uniref:Methylmalonic aciduria and homocystinuria type D homolog, mitochondrial n=1 Tax=Drosophila pseudoobscura pseudoobscura TaxID=46245 RepID=Q29HF3_DROPS|nr:methylmalonic aciduria and homocystinuria type D homolog, mitochondrial [Drosophila pseudoobscura]XP_015041647.1 methylmalonic aciduria and homocystinuria type D homolog, mitochondrial [Drosophila pseudoobscura]